MRDIKEAMKSCHPRKADQKWTSRKKSDIPFGSIRKPKNDCKSIVRSTVSHEAKLSGKAYIYFCLQNKKPPALFIRQDSTALEVEQRGTRTCKSFLHYSVPP